MGAMNADLLPVLDRFPNARVDVLGDLVADEFVYGETERISREAPVLIVRYEQSEVRPGCGANAIANLCALKAQVRAFGLLGTDDVGRQLLDALRDAGADVNGVHIVSGPTATKTRILAGGKNTRRQQIVRVDKEGPHSHDPQFVKRLTDALTASKEVLLVSDYGLGLLSRQLIESVRKLPRKVCVDSRYALQMYTGVYLAKPNEVELEQAVGRHVGDNLEAAGRELLEKLEVQALLVTRGRNGMTLLRPGTATASVAVHGSADAVDVTGAGDTVMAAATIAIAAGADPVQAMRIANVAGALKVKKPGTATVSLEELRAELQK
jgi:rfaE bifunctional protein kinase chain/domain